MWYSFMYTGRQSAARVQLAPALKQQQQYLPYSVTHIDVPDALPVTQTNNINTLPQQIKSVS